MMIPVAENLLLGLAIAIVIAFLAYKAKSLNPGGAIGAAFLGTIVIGLGGAGWAVLLLSFFISSSGLSLLFRKKKGAIGQNFAKGSRRDAAQVAANGGVAGLMVLLYFFVLQSQSQTASLFWIGFAASLAGANADTWGTELGILNPRQPRLITTLKPVPKGTSGGVSLVGTIAGLTGSGLIGGLAILCQLVGWAPGSTLPLWVQFLIITGAGFLGSVVDSLLGATLQGIYYCPVCSKETERHPLHTCGTPTHLARGIKWINNDWVNTTCTLSAGLIGLLLTVIFQ